MVHPCDKPCGNKTASGYCATTVCINPKYSNIGTAQYGQGVQKRILTNYDLLIRKTPEELAGILGMQGVVSPPWCTENYDCPYADQDPVRCDLCALNWLRQEAE